MKFLMVNFWFMESVRMRHVLVFFMCSMNFEINSSGFGMFQAENRAPQSVLGMRILLYESYPAGTVVDGSPRVASLKRLTNPIPLLMLEV